jgi:hypothetical protein
MLIQRLIDFYNRSNPDASKLSHIWNGMLRTYQGELIKALTHKDSLAIQNIFEDPKKSFDVIYGLDTPIMQYWGKEITTDYFPFLARRIGIVPVKHPLNPSPDENWNPKDGIKLKKQIEEVIGPIHVPNGFLVKDNSHGIPYSYFSRMAEWFTVSSLINPPPKRILEIGAGTGGFGLVAFNNGVRDYTIIDIPAIAVISAYYLSKAFEEDKVWLDGESPNPNAVGRWFSCHDYDGAKSEYDLIVNMNSFPEMSIENQDGYVRFIYECLSKNGMFYSCNHESNLSNQSSARLAVNRHGGFKTIYRAPFMMRDGYMEEFYQRK